MYWNILLVFCLAYLQQSETTIPTSMTSAATIVNGRSVVTTRITAQSISNLYCVLSSSGQDSQSFTIAPGTGGSISVVSGCTLNLVGGANYAVKNSYSIVVTVYDADFPTHFADTSVSVSVDTNAFFPAEGGYSGCVQDGATADTFVLTAIAIPSTAGDTFVYTLSGTGNGDFTMTTDGDVKVATGVTLSAASQAGYCLVVSADPAGTGTDGATELYIAVLQTCKASHIAGSFVVVLSLILCIFMMEL